MIQFLSGLNVLGNIKLNNNELKEVVIDNLASAPTGFEGKIYYDTATKKLRLFADGSWINFQTGSDGNTTYDLNVPVGTTAIGLDGSDGTQDNVTITGGTNVSVVRTSATELTINATDSAIGTVTNVAIAITGDALKGSVGNPTGSASISITPQGTAGQYINGQGDLVSFPTLASGRWTLAGSSGAGQVITSGSTASFLQGNGISTVASATGKLTITNTLPFNSISLSGSAGASTSIPNNGAINILGGSNISTTSSAGGVTIAYTGGTGTMSSWILSGDSGSNQTIANGNTVDIAGGSYVSTVASSTDKLTVNVLGTTTATADRLIGRDSNGYGYVQTPASGDSSTKIATTAFVQAAVTGLLEFKGGFNAATGILANGSGGDLYTNVPVAIGDYYVVTKAGNFFGNPATPLTPGDSVIVQANAGAGAATEASFIIVQSDTDLATGTTVGIGNVKGTGGEIGVTYAGGTGTITNLAPNVIQDVFKTITGDTGSQTAVGANTSFKIKGNGSVTTAVSGNQIVITGVNNTYTAGDGIVLTGSVFSANVNGSNPSAPVSTSTTTNRTYSVQYSAAKKLVVNVPWTNSIYSLPTATTSILGGIKIATQAEVDAGTNASDAVVPRTLKEHLDKQSFSDRLPSTDTATWTITAAQHGLGTSPKIVQVYTYEKGTQQFMAVECASNGDVTFSCTKTQLAGSLICNLMKVR